MNAGGLVLRPAGQGDVDWLRRLAAEPSVARVLAVDAVDRLPAALRAGELVVIETDAGEPVGAARLAGAQPPQPSPSCSS